MRKVTFTKEHLWGPLITLFVLILFFLQFDVIESLEYKTFDLRTKLRSNPSPGEEIVIVAIDNDSIAKLGRWPWPRSLIAKMINVLATSGAKVIGLNILISEPEENNGLLEIRKLRESFINLGFQQEKISELKDQIASYRKKDQVAFNPKVKAPDKKLSEERIAKFLEKKLANFSARSQEFLHLINEAESRLDNDTKLYESIQQSRNTVLPMFFQLSPALWKNEGEALPSFLISSALTTIVPTENSSLSLPIAAHNVTPPLPKFAEAAKGIGHINFLSDSDGTIRWEILLVEFQKHYFPSFALQVAMKYFNLSEQDAEVMPGEGIAFGPQKVPTDQEMKMLISYNGPNKTFPYYSFYDVLHQKVNPSVFKDKIVLIGATASGIYNALVTPVSTNLPGIEMTANVIENILHQNFIYKPYWARIFEFGIVVFFGLFSIFLLPKLKAKTASFFSFALLLTLIVFVSLLFIMKGMWLPIIYPSILLLFSYVFITSRRFLVTERAKERVEADSIETNKMLGLSFQGQGMLDIAFEKFRKCPVDDSMKDIFYNLGLDFERKRQFNKAAAVYEYIEKHDLSFKDVRDRSTKMRTAGETMIFGISGKKTAAGDKTIMVEVDAEKPTLGRYEIIGELGKGAMGIVYKGRDPKINRTVAIKTIRFDQEFEGDQVKEMKERFFREAEAAGILNHPNIVTIYDVGEDYDLSYMAMEFLEGTDLESYCKKETLLSVKKVLEICARVADALDYAHQKGIVHRDIKPANIVLLNNGEVKVTDFGIARITSSSKTQTGIILGTPSYMSPEQVVGKKVDGRSDLFSLGVVLYELVTGERPFHGESIATLMYQIANTPHPSPRRFNDSLSPSFEEVINKALEKESDTRYQRGSAMALELRKLGQEL